MANQALDDHDPRAANAKNFDGNVFLTRLRWSFLVQTGVHEFNRGIQLRLKICPSVLLMPSLIEVLPSRLRCWKEPNLTSPMAVANSG